MKKAYSTIRAFTLIELLVVIAIIALLTGIILTSLTASKAKARDAERVSDLGQIQLALELYFDRCHQYPPSTVGNGIGAASALASASCTQQSVNVPFTNYISAIPTPPAGSTYDYVTNLTGSSPPSSATDYILHVTLEGVSSASANGLTSPPSYAQGFTCDTNLNYCVGPK